MTIWPPFFQGFEAAVAAGAKEVAVFPAASESFSKANLNCGIEDNLARCRDIASASRSLRIPVRGYDSYSYILMMDKFEYFLKIYVFLLFKTKGLFICMVNSCFRHILISKQGT